MSRHDKDKYFSGCLQIGCDVYNNFTVDSGMNYNMFVYLNYNKNSFIGSQIVLSTHLHLFELVIHWIQQIKGVHVFMKYFNYFPSIICFGF